MHKMVNCQLLHENVTCTKTSATKDGRWRVKRVESLTVQNLRV